MKNDKGTTLDIIKRLEEFFESKGGSMAVAKSINKHPNKLYVISRNETLPSIYTLLEIKEAYPDFDLNWIISGDTPNKLSQSISNESNKEEKGSGIEEKILKLQEENIELRKDKMVFRNSLEALLSRIEK